MSRVLFISNGHGEAAIADRIAGELPAPACEHLPLVGVGEGSRVMPLVGPRTAMPSGGLVAMGNVRAFSQDLRAGFLRLFTDQIGFIRTYGKSYACIVAVGDVYALALSLFAQRPIVFVGTAKSVYIAGYGPFERVLLRRAERVFVRDEPTARALRERGVARAQAPGNTIADLSNGERPAREGAWIGVLPGSRKQAYEDGMRLARVIRMMPAQALFSVAPGLEAQTFAQMLAADGWSITPSNDEEAPFEAHDAGGARLLAWRGALGALLRASCAVLGQAGTANEAAAACGIPVVALETDSGGWYRMRQQRLLGEALAIVPAQPAAAAHALQALLQDRERLEHMRAVGRERMGAPGGSRVVAAAIAELCA